ncbi:MAG: prepilin-type N-terminal cleavage/methylation domain-containing protein, partial [Phycisphaerales bacterium]|nr:prepilin-type N-terminal cleavage/methylation domain-containing protein [Phycisphaerales bacterium]
MARMNAVPRRLTFSRGFTLIELALVLVIVA